MIRKKYEPVLRRGAEPREGRGCLESSSAAAWAERPGLALDYTLPWSITYRAQVLHPLVDTMIDEAPRYCQSSTGPRRLRQRAGNDKPGGLGRRTESFYACDGRGSERNGGITGDVSHPVAAAGNGSSSSSSSSSAATATVSATITTTASQRGPEPAGDKRRCEGVASRLGTFALTRIMRLWVPSNPIGGIN